MPSKPQGIVRRIKAHQELTQARDGGVLLRGHLDLARGALGEMSDETAALFAEANPLANRLIAIVDRVQMIILEEMS